MAISSTGTPSMSMQSSNGTVVTGVVTTATAGDGCIISAQIGGYVDLTFTDGSTFPKFQIPTGVSLWNFSLASCTASTGLLTGLVAATVTTVRNTKTRPL